MLVTIDKTHVSMLNLTTKVRVNNNLHRSSSQV